MQKNKHKVIKQVYRVKRDGRLNKNSDLTLDKEKPVVEEQSVNSIDEIVLHDDHGSNNIVEQCSSSAGGQDKSIYIGSDRTGLTSSSDQSEPGKSGGAKNRIKPTFEELLDKYKKISAQKTKQSIGRQTKKKFFITKIKKASTVIVLVFIIYSVDACAMECIFRYTQL